MNGSSLRNLLPQWWELLRGWALDGSIHRGASEALGLAGEPPLLRELISQWAAGEFHSLPPIELLPAASMAGAAGAYALSTGTIYLNADWLRVANGEQVLAVLTEELGHHLDALLNASDTPGDEGAIFAALVRGEVLSPRGLAELRTEDDSGRLEVNGHALAAEYSNPTVSLSLTSPAPVMEDGTANLIYTFTRTGATTSALTVNYTVGGTANLVAFGLDPADYIIVGSTLTGTSRSVTFAAGSATATVTVDPTADSTIEANETVAFTLAAGSGYTIGTTTAVTGSITNDDFPVITLAVSPASVTEDGSANLIYTFSRTGATTSALTVNYTVGGTATLGTDYTGIAATPATKTVSFAAGSATATVTVDPTADNALEDDETVALALAAGSGYTVGTTAAVVGTISNDDSAATGPPKSLSA